MKMTRIVFVAFVLGIFISFNAMAGNEKDEELSSLANTEWVLETEGQFGIDSLILIFQTDSTCLFAIKRFTEEGTLEYRSSGKYKYYSPNITFTVTVTESQFRRGSAITKGVLKDGELEIFKADKTSFIMERKQETK